MALLTAWTMNHWNMTDEGGGIWSKTPYNLGNLSPVPEPFYILFNATTSQWYITNSTGTERRSVTWTQDGDLRDRYETLLAEPLNEFSAP